jgi:murein DD-endopeptidase MepM/ murein hydrolase activator NlpD
MKKNITVVLLLVLAAGCTSNPRDAAFAPPLDPTRKVSEQDCSRPVDTGGANLMCREVTEAERRARLAEEERQAKAKKDAEERAARERREAEERAERERLERERAEQLAREEAARKAKAAEEERLAAERRRLEAAAALKAQQEREAKEKAEAEALARQRAEQEKREAAERECRRLEQESSDGREILENFVATYGKVEEFKGIAAQISAFLGKARKVKPCAPA